MKIKHVSSCFAKLTNTKHCFEMFTFEVLKLSLNVVKLSFIPFIRISYVFQCLHLWSVFVPFLWVSYVFLEFLNLKKSSCLKKYTSANQKRCLKFTAKITMPNYTLFECTVFMYIMQWRNEKKCVLLYCKVKTVCSKNLIFPLGLI